MIPIRITLSPDAYVPTRGSRYSSGYDLYTPIDVLIRAGQVVVIHSGVSLQIPDGWEAQGWEAQVRPRSSLNARGLWVAVGTIDSDYRGIIGATMINLTREDATVKRGERFAQLVFARVGQAEFEIVVELSATERGGGGFGSSGR